jgi:hypothetical protein
VKASIESVPWGRSTSSTVMLCKGNNCSTRLTADALFVWRSTQKVRDKSLLLLLLPDEEEDDACR